MKCPKCSKKTKHTREDFDYSKTSGIPDCWLTKVDTYYCKKCDFKFHDIGDIQKVNEAIAKTLLNAIVIKKEQVKFLQVHLFEESIFEFAKRLEIPPKTLQALYKGPSMNLHARRVSRKLQDEIIKYFMMKPITIEFE